MKMIEFSDIPYLQYVSQSDGHIFPQFLQLTNHKVFDDWINQDHRYDSFLRFYNDLGLENKENPTIQEKAHLIVYRNYLIDYLTNASNSLMKKDEKIKKILRQLYILAIKKEGRDRLQIDNDFLEFFNSVQRAVPEDSIRKFWINESIVKYIEVDKVTDSIEYILYIIRQRDRIFNNLAIYFQKLIHIETALYYIETGNPFTKDLPGNDVFENPRIKYHPNQFWDTTGEIRSQNQFTWQETYEFVKNDMEELTLPFSYSSFDSFRKSIPSYLKGIKFPKKGSNMS